MVDQNREDKIASAFGQGISPRIALEEFEPEGKGYGEQDQDHNAQEEAASWRASDVGLEDAYGSVTDYVVYEQ